MRKIIFLVLCVLTLSVSAAAQTSTTTQNARRLPTGSGAPSGSCVAGPPFIQTYIDYATTPPTTYYCKSGTWTASSGGATAAPKDATYITQTANATLTNEQALASLATGVVRNTTTTGVLSSAELSGDVTTSGSNVVTLASTITAGGPTGSATVTPVITYDAKGRLTTVTTATIAPPFSAITGTPTTLAGYGITNGQIGPLTGDVTTSGAAATIANNAVTLAKLATQATNTVLGNATSGTAVPTALAVGTCSTAGSALIWTTNTGFGCNTSITAAAAPVSGLTGAGTGVLTALAVNVGTAGAPVVNGGALGTPSSGTGANITGIPAANILAGSFGAGAYVISTSLQAATIELGAATDTTLSRVSAGVIAVEGVNVLLNGGALGSPSSVGTLPAHTLGGTITGGGNAINGANIGVSSPGTGAFTTLSATGNFTLTGNFIPAGDNTVSIGQNTGVIGQVSSYLYAAPSGGQFYFTASATNPNTPDTMMTRKSAGIVRFGTSTANSSGSVETTGATVLGALIHTGITSDATHTDRTVCEDTTTNQYYSGSGTLGICLGTSSARFKPYIADLPVGLAQVMSLRPVQYRLDAVHGDPAKLLYGFTAEEGGVVLPVLMGRDVAGNPNTFDYLGIVPVLVRAIQEQQKEIETLKARLNN